MFGGGSDSSDDEYHPGQHRSASGRDRGDAHRSYHGGSGGSDIGGDLMGGENPFKQRLVDSRSVDCDVSILPGSSLSEPVRLFPFSHCSPPLSLSLFVASNHAVTDR